MSIPYTDTRYESSVLMFQMDNRGDRLHRTVLHSRTHVQAVPAFMGGPKQNQAELRRCSNLLNPTGSEFPHLRKRCGSEVAEGAL